MVLPGNLPRGQSWLVEFMQRLGYKSALTGVCFGIALMWIQAILLNQVDVFDQRLLDMYEAFRLSLPATPDMLAFLDGIELNQQPWFYNELFAGLQPYMQSAIVTMPFIQSLMLEAAGLVSVEPFSGAYTRDGLHAYFLTLQKAIHDHEATDHPVTMLLRAYDHTITVTYDRVHKTWNVLDPSASLKTRKFDTIEGLVKEVHLAFDSSPNCIFSTSLFCTEKNKQTISKIHDAWQNNSDFKRLHEVTKDNINARDANGFTWLMTAVLSDDAKLVEALLKNGAKPDLFSDIARSPLFIAATQNNIKIIDLLIHFGADVNLKSPSDGQTALIAAAQSGANNALKLLIDHGADVNATFKPDSVDETATVLYAAVLKKHPDTVACLLEAGADVAGLNLERGITALGLAAQIGEVQSVKHLLNAGADISLGQVSHSQSPLHLATRELHTEVVNVLLNKGADMNQVNADVVTPYCAARVAVLKGDLDAVKKQKCDDILAVYERHKLAARKPSFFKRVFSRKPKASQNNTLEMT